jgi:hypothetical protein
MRSASVDVAFTYAVHQFTKVLRGCMGASGLDHKQERVEVGAVR